MAARIEEERESTPARNTPTRTSSTPAPTRRDDSSVTEVSLTQWRVMNPGWVSVAQGG